MSAELSVLGVVATPLVVPAAVVAATAYGLYEAGKNVLDAAHILAEEKRLIKDLSNKVKDYTIKSQDNESLKKTLDKIIEYFTKKDTLHSKNYVLDKIDSVESIQDKIAAGYNLIEIETRFTVLREHFYSLLALNKKIGGNIDDVIEDFNNLALENPDRLKESVDNLLNKIKTRFSCLKEEFETQLKDKTFENEFISVEEVEERLLLSVFDSELNKMLAYNDDTKTIELINKKSTLATLVRIYNICSILSSNQYFSMYANQVLALWSKAIKLSNRNDISIDDYRYEIDMISTSLDQIEQNIVKSKKDAYEGIKTFNDLMSMNNAYRKLLHLTASEREFNIDSLEKDINDLVVENAKFEKELQRIEAARTISEKLVIKYAKSNYKFIMTSEPKIVGEHIILKTYLITPDEKNILCLTVNESGNISGEVVGVKIAGLPDDILSIFESQKVFCSHTKMILQSLFTELEIGMPEVLVEDPEINKTTRSKDFSSILPPDVIDVIKEARLKRAREEKKKRAI